MGLFLQAAIITDCQSRRAEKCIEKLATGENPYGLILNACRFNQQHGDVFVYFNDYCSGYEGLAKDLSIETENAVMLLYIYDGDFWGYYFYWYGAEIDRFSPIPYYFDDNITETEAKRFAGNAQELTKWFEVDESAIKYYLVDWHDREEENAYPEDQYPYGESWQMVDFIQKLGYRYDFTEEEDAITKDECKKELLPSIEELLSLSPKAPTKQDPDCGIFTTGFLPNALDGKYVHTILQDDTQDMFKFLGSTQPYTALDMLREKIDQKHPDPVLYTLSAFCHYWLGNPNAAYWDLSSALDYDPNNIMLLRARSLLVAISAKPHLHIKDLTKLLALDPANSDVYLLSRAFFHLLNSRHSTIKLNDTYADLEKLVRDGFPDQHDPRINIDGFSDYFMALVAEVKNRASNNTLANRKKEINALITLDDIAFICKENFNNILDLLQNADFEAAILECTKEIENDPSHCNLYLIRAYSYQHDRSWRSTPKKILDDLTSALKYDPDNIIALRARGLMSVSANQSKCKQQIEDLSRLIEMDPDYGDVYLHHRSFVYYELNDFEKTFIDLEAFAQFGQSQLSEAAEALEIMKKKLSKHELNQIINKHHLQHLQAHNNLIDANNGKDEQAH